MAMAISSLLLVVVVVVIVSIDVCTGSQDQDMATLATTTTEEDLLQQLPEAWDKKNLLTDTGEDSLPYSTAEEVFQGRKLKVRRRLLLKALVFLKALWLGVLMPLALVFSLASSWQAATISFVALGASAFFGLKTGPGSHPHPVHPTNGVGWWQDRDWNLDPDEYKRRRRH